MLCAECVEDFRIDGDPDLKRFEDAAGGFAYRRNAAIRLLAKARRRKAGVSA